MEDLRLTHTDIDRSPIAVSVGDSAAIHARIRESERAAQRLIGRAAHIEKYARRPRMDLVEQRHLNARATELRAEAQLLIAEICELSRRLIAS